MGRPRADPLRVGEGGFARRLRPFRQAGRWSVNAREALVAAARRERVAADVEPFVSAAAAEGMIGLLARAAERVPRSLRVQALAMEARAARMVVEMARVTAAFEEARIPLLVFKGPLLPHHLYLHP